MPQGHHVATYVPEKQYEDWKEKSEEMDMSMSEWVMGMVEAGQKKFDRDIQPDESKRELRKRNTDLWKDFQAATEERDRFRKQLLQTEQPEILEFIGKNQGCRYKEIAKHLAQNRGSRLTQMLDVMDGDEIEIDEEGRVYSHD